MHLLFCPINIYNHDPSPGLLLLISLKARGHFSLGQFIPQWVEYQNDFLQGTIRRNKCK